MGVVVGVDVGGSGLRCQSVVDGVPGPVLSGAGLRIGPAGIDVAALVDSVVPLVPAGPDVLVWSMRGLLALADPGAVMALIRERVGAQRVSVCGDALAAMVGAVGSVRPGAVVAAGTGAVAFATDFVQVWRRVDGWGHVLGDRGSSAWLGLRALKAALLTLDGVAPGGEALLAAATERLGPPEGWPRVAMTRPDAVAVIADLAPAVSALAPTDEVAAGICAQAGRELARSLAAAAQGIEGVCLSRTGGLFGAASVLEAFEAEAISLGLDVQPPARTGLGGAVLLAEHLAAGRPLTGHAAYLQIH
ncbi:MAG: BadF/BadG/BcrA/BcrD ATPase family protein [Lapillicoccus sp.]